jgi:aminoglycoside phosphotransferase (APT) family kinase protein
VEGKALLDPASAEGRAAIAAVLARSGHGDARVVSATALSGGAASATWRLELEGGRLAIFQRTALGAIGGLPRAIQADIARRAGALGVPVAPLLAVPEPGDGLGDAAITAHVAGEALAPRWLKDPALAPARAALVGQCAEALARLHAAPLAHWAHLPLGGGSGEVLLLQMFEAYRRFGVDVPAFDLAFAFLKPRMPRDPPRCLVHGDFRSGNILVGPGGLAAVLDWELAHLSVPEEDLGWLCVQAWRFGQWNRPVGGFGTREALVRAYRAAGGSVDEGQLWTWEVFGNLRWGMSCLQLADDHVSGRIASVERAAIGRRVSEVAADLLHAIERGCL